MKLLCLTIYAVAALHAHTPLALAACAAVALILILLTRLPVRSIAAALRPLAAILVVTAVMQVLYFQQGDVLANIGPVAITGTALRRTLVMMSGLVCVMAASIAFMRSTPSQQLVAAFGWLLSPLRRLGVHVDAFMLAVSVAFGFVPVLAGEFERLRRAQIARMAVFDGPVRIRLAAYRRLFPPLVRSSFRRADRLADGFLARCFGASSRRTCLCVFSPGLRDAILVALALATLALSFF